LGHLRVPGPVKDLIEDDWANLQKKYVFAEKEVTYNNVVQSVESIRIIAFLAVFSEAILLTMLPNYAEQFYQAEWIISKQFVATLPIIFFTLFAAVSIFGSTYLNSRLGIRKSLLFGLAVYIFGHLLAFFMGTFLAFILTRCVTALGYGITFASCQNYVATYSESKDRVQSYAIFVVASGSGFLCGTPVGGILVDNIGQSYTFIVAFLIGLLSFYFAKINTLDAKADFSYESLNRGQIRHILKEKEFMSSLTLSGFPTRLMFTALIGYFYPLYLVSLGNSPSAVGRIMMLFGFFMFVVAPFAARAVSRFKIPHYAALFCSTFIALSLLMVWYYGNTISVMIGIVAYTVAAVIHISSMMSIIEHVSCNEDNKLSRSSVLMFYFVVERFSMIVGPALFGFILTASSFSKTLLWVSLGLILINGVYAYLLFGQSKPERGQK
jgi:predicted MFS family arabinose efflux permease